MRAPEYDLVLVVGVDVWMGSVFIVHIKYTLTYTEYLYVRGQASKGGTVSVTSTLAPAPSNS